MNWIVHIILGYFATSLFMANAKELFLLIILFSLIVDIDHWLPFIKMFLKRQRNVFNYYKSAESIELRSALHEFPFTIVFLIIALLLLQTNLHSDTLLVAAICVPTHFLVDFIANHTRPFRPFSNKVFFMGWYKTPKGGMVFEGIVTSILLIVYFMFV